MMFPPGETHKVDHLYKNIGGMNIWMHQQLTHSMHYSEVKLFEQTQLAAMADLH